MSTCSDVDRHLVFNRSLSSLLLSYRRPMITRLNYGIVLEAFDKDDLKVI